MDTAMTERAPLPLHHHPDNNEQRRIAFVMLLRDRAGKPNGTPREVAAFLGLSHAWYTENRRRHPEFKSDTDDILALANELKAEEAEAIILNYMRGEYSPDNTPDFAAAKFVLQHLNARTYGPKVDHQHSGTITLTVPRATRISPSDVIDATPTLAALPGTDGPTFTGGVPEDTSIPYEEWEEEDE
jgi:hypothetical protein